MKKILFILSQYRVGERIYPIIPNLAQTYELHLLPIYQMRTNYIWPGDVDLRSKFYSKYLKYFKHVLNTADDVLEYDLIISDDNRLTSKTSLDKIYSKRKCMLLANSHGNGSEANIKTRVGHTFDKCLVFGQKDNLYPWTIAGGIPSNDCLKQYCDLQAQHILVIVNFLDNVPSSYPFIKINKDTIQHFQLEKLQRIYNLPIVFKLKSRGNENAYPSNKQCIQYIESILPKSLDYRIMIDTEDDNILIAHSACVLSAPSTLALKSIQLGIPSVLFKGMGETGVFFDYDGMFNLGDDFLSYIAAYQRKEEFINSTIEGGLDFSSTDIMISNIKQFL